MQRFQEEKHRDQRKKSKDRQIGALTEDPVEQLHQPDEAFFIGHMASLVDQLEFQPVDPVVTTHRNTAGRDSRQEAEYGGLRHQVPRLLTIVPHRRSRHPPARQVSCRIGAVAHAEAESHRYEC